MATWNRDLIYQRSLAMGQEFFDTGIQIALTPVTGVLSGAPLEAVATLKPVRFKVFAQTFTMI